MLWPKLLSDHYRTRLAKCRTPTLATEKVRRPSNPASSSSAVLCLKPRASPQTHRPLLLRLQLYFDPNPIPKP